MRGRLGLPALLLIGMGGATATAFVGARLYDPGPPAPVAEAEARAFLDTAIDVGLAGDYPALCAMNGSVRNCELTLDGNAIHPPATTRPESIRGHHVGIGDGNDTAGWVFTVKGRDGAGKAYATEVMVFRDHEDRLKGTNIVWWSGARLVVGHGTEDVIETAPAS